MEYNNIRVSSFLPAIPVVTPIYAVTAPKWQHLPASTMLWQHLPASTMLWRHLPASTMLFRVNKMGCTRCTLRKVVFL
jgi:hypothetical protein